MPSPVGHALGAIAVGWALSPRVETRRAAIVSTAIFAAIGVAPDLDLLIGRHSRETHSLGAAAVLAAVAAWRRWPIGSTRRQIFVAAFLAWFSHPLLDALGSDTAPPLGVMALWPFSTAHFQFGWSVFAPISRSWWSVPAMLRNVLAVAREVAILGPVVFLAAWARRPPPRVGAAP